MVKAFIEAGVSVNAKKYGSPKETRPTIALHNAVWRQHAKVVEFLLKQERIELNLLNVDGRTPLMIAVEKGNEEIVDMLLAAGADTKPKNERGVDAATLAEKAVEKQKRIQEKVSALKK